MICYICGHAINDGDEIQKLKIRKSPEGIEEMIVISGNMYVHSKCLVLKREKSGLVCPNCKHRGHHKVDGYGEESAWCMMFEKYRNENACSKGHCTFMCPICDKGKYLNR